MKRILKLLNSNKKFILGIILGILLTSTTVYAVTALATSISYDNTSSGLNSTNVQGALDELYTMAKTKIPDTPFKLGDYFTLVPDASTFTIKAATTGYDTDQTITPNELTLWRVIDIHSDGSVDAVSEYTSSTEVYFEGTTGFTNYVGVLQTIAAQYAKAEYTISTRMMGYAGQTPTIVDTSAFDGTTGDEPFPSNTRTPLTGTGQEYSGGVLGDTLYLKDYLLVNNVYNGVIANKVGTSTANKYFLSSRYYRSGSLFGFGIRYVNNTIVNNSPLNATFIREHKPSGSFNNYYNGFAVRPIITLKSGVTIALGSGTKDSPYTLS